MSKDNVYSMELSLSKKNLNCDEILYYLYKSKIPCSITKNKSIVNEENNVYIEDGCRIIFNHLDNNQLNCVIWKPLSKKYELKCAHLKVYPIFSGCIHNYLPNKKCE